jgi:hypothetical protein
MAAEVDQIPEEVQMTYDPDTMTAQEKAVARGDFLDTDGTPEPEGDKVPDTPPEPEQEEDQQDPVQEPEQDDVQEGEQEEPPEQDAGDDPDDPGEAEQVPYGRLAKEVSRRKDLEGKLQALEERFNAMSQGQPEQPKQEAPKDPLQEKRELLKAKNAEYQEAIIDGDVELATTLYSELLDINQDLAVHRATTAVQERSSKDQITEAANDLVSRNEEFFLDPVNVEMFNGARAAYMQQGLSFVDAMRKAEERLIPKAKAEPPAKDPDPTVAETARAAQQRRAVEKNARAAQQQPPRAEGGEGMRREPSKKRSVKDLSDKEFISLSEAEKKKLRGDIVPEA